MINQIRLAGLDLDGTLLKNDKTLSERTKTALKNAYNKGITPVPVTGRPLSGIPKCITALDEIRYVISTNGAQITDIKNNIAVYSSPIENDSALEIICEAEKRKLSYEVFADGVGYIENSVMQKYMQTYGGTPVGEYILASRQIVLSVKALFEEKKKSADEIFIVCESKSQRDEFASELKKYSSVQLCLLEDCFLEVTKKGTDKGKALEILCAHLDIPIESAAAFGDGENDVSFLKAAGVAVAMGNANEKIKAVADITAPTNEKDGVAAVLEGFIG